MNSNRRAALTEVFQDTKQFYQTEPALIAAVDASKKGTRLYDADHIPALPKEACDCNCKCKAGKVTVIKARTFEAAVELRKKYPDKHIAVLNFASAVTPGGGVLHGSSAQEESLCRCSTLYPTLETPFLMKQYYGVNRTAYNPLHTDACIYSPDIVICKTDTDVPERLPQNLWSTVDVITCAAPDLRVVGVSPEILMQLHENRARAILSVAYDNKVDILVLGAFGCGAFNNDPGIVAKAYANVLKECHSCFDQVVFAIYCRNYELTNYNAFSEELSSLTLTL